MIKYSKDGLVSFDEETHSYYLEGRKLTSVTQYISKNKPFFDSEKVAGIYAKKHNKKKEDVLLEWEEKGNEACIMGSFVHKMFEDYILGVPVSINPEYPKCRVAKKFIRDYFDNGILTPLEAEYIVYNDDMAGQVDCIVKNKKGENFIIDWKTNKEIKYENKWQSMLGEFSNLEDCSFNHYSLQLSKYKEMCTEYDIKKCYIIHLKNDRYDIIEAKDLL